MFRKFFCFSLLLGLLVSGVSCRKEEGSVPSGDEGLRRDLTVSFDFPVTKGTPLAGQELDIQNMHLFVFDSRGFLDVFHTFTSAEISSKTVTERVRSGVSSVYLLANVYSSSLSGIMEEDELKDIVIDLPVFHSGGGRLPLIATGTVTIPSTGIVEQPTLSLMPAVARIVFHGVENQLTGTLSSKPLRLAGAVLCNFLGNGKVGGGEAGSPMWMNQECRRGHVKADVIGWSFGSTVPQSVYAESTYGVSLSPGQTLLEYFTANRPYYYPFAPTGYMVETRCIPYDLFMFYGDYNSFNTYNFHWPMLEAAIPYGSSKYVSSVFYSFPNARKVANDGWHDTFLPTATTLVVVLDVGDITSDPSAQRYWYPVPLYMTDAANNGIEAGKEYTVTLTVTGVGNDVSEPFKRIERVSLEASIDVKDWVAGPSYSETI